MQGAEDSPRVSGGKAEEKRGRGEKEEREGDRDKEKERVGRARIGMK